MKNSKELHPQRSSNAQISVPHMVSHSLQMIGKQYDPGQADQFDLRLIHRTIAQF